MQPDSIIPNPANPQSWNRYSYVENRPILFNDPFGRDSVCGHSYSDPECPPYISPSPSTLLTESPGNCSGIPDCGLSDTNDPVSYPDEPLVDLKQNEPGNNYSSETSTVIQPDGPPFWGYGWLIRGGKFLLDLLTYIGNHGTPLYRQAKGFGVFGPWLEGLAGFFFQIAADLDDPRFTPLQKFARAFIVGGEDALTDVASTFVAADFAILGTVAGEVAGGAIGGYFGGGFGALAGAGIGGPIGGSIGWVSGSLATNYVGNYFWSNVNEALLPTLFP